MKWDKWDKKGFMFSDERNIASSYHDNVTTKELYTLLGNAVELKRVNDHRGTDWSQEKLDEIIRIAIALREAGGQA